MAKAKNGTTPAASDPATTIMAGRTEGETDGNALARIFLGPAVRHGYIASYFACGFLGKDAERPGINDAARFVKGRAEKAAAGDMTFASNMMAAQALTLDSMFTELARRAANNLGEYPQTAERYGRLAMKAQSNCRATLEALAKLHQPREQTVRHVHVNEGGQAIVADQFHQHTGGAGNEKGVEQSHATGSAGTGPALPCPNPLGDAVPIASGSRQAALQDARRN